MIININNKHIVQAEKVDSLFTPAPNYYYPKLNDKSDPKWRIGTAKRKSLSKKDNYPAPGKYNYQQFVGNEGPKYTMREKFDIDGKNLYKSKSKTESTPGPGQYNIKDSKASPMYTIREKNLLKKRRKSQDSRNYDLRDDKNLLGNSGNIFGKTSRYDKLEYASDKYQTPAPNKYKYDLNVLSSKAPKYGFSKAERFPYENKSKRPNTSTPGPGFYKHKLYVGHQDAPSFSFYREKKFYKSKYEENKNPAANQYFNNISYRPDSSIYSIPKDKRKFNIADKSKISAPGPDKYNPKYKYISRIQQFPIYSIGIGNRDGYVKKQGTIKDKDSEMGPGRYIIKNGKLPEGPVYTFRARNARTTNNKTPSPTRYNASTINHPREPSYTIGKSTREDNLNQIIKDNYPGPASYKISDSQGTARFINFPKEQKLKANDNNVPGPGFYKIPCRFNDISELTRSKGIYMSQFQYV